jgi:hypothetical protein
MRQEDDYEYVKMCKKEVVAELKSRHSPGETEGKTVKIDGLATMQFIIFCLPGCHIKA